MVLFRRAWLSAIELLRLLVNVWVALWFAAIPAGTEIMMAREKPNAITTSNARILRLEMFLKARLKTPKSAPSFKIQVNKGLLV